MSLYDLPKDMLVLLISTIQEQTEKKVKKQVQEAVNAFANACDNHFEAAYTGHQIDGSSPWYEICDKCKGLEIFDTHGDRVFSNVNENGAGGFHRDYPCNSEGHTDLAVCEQHKTNFLFLNECHRCDKQYCLNCRDTLYHCHKCDCYFCTDCCVVESSEKMCYSCYFCNLNVPRGK